MPLSCTCIAQFIRSDGGGYVRTLQVIDPECRVHGEGETLT